jgi:ABC-type multidrug transport system fused ATPase/permease subunit
MRPSLSVYRGFLTRYLADCRGQVALLALLLLAHTAAGVYAPQLLRGIVDELTARGASVALAHAAAWFLAVATVRQLTRGAAAVIGENVSWVATNRVRIDLVRHTLGLDPGIMARYPPGAMLERIDGDANQLAAFFSQFSLRLLAAGLLLTGILVALLIEDWQLSLALFLFAVAVVWILLNLRSFGVPFYDRLRETAADLHGFVEERLAAIEEIKALGGLVRTLQRMTGLIGAQVHHAKRAYSLGTLVWPLVNVVMGVGTGLMMAWGGAQALRGDMTLGTLYLMFSYINLLFWPFEDLAHQMEELQKAGGNVVRIQRLLEERSSLADGTREAFPRRPASIAFEQVSFRYPGNGTEPQEQVLSDLSLTIAPGRTLGILGRTGSGKTTIMRLLARLYDPQAGRVTVDGVDLRDFRLREVRARIAVVTQEVQFFGATIRDNLALFDAAVDDRRIEAALDRLHLLPWLAAQPDGLDTVLASAQLALSAGEAQRLALVRVLLRDPDIVILDEAAARLDPASEHEVEEALATLLAGRTGVVIAHRPGAVEKVDDILILDRGRMVEHGPRQQLLANPDSRLHELLTLSTAEDPTPAPGLPS